MTIFYQFWPPLGIVYCNHLNRFGLLNNLVQTNWKSVKNWGRYEILNIRYRLPEIVVKIAYISNFTGFGIFCSKSHIGLNSSPIFNSFEPKCSGEQVGSTDTIRPFLSGKKFGENGQKSRYWVTLIIIWVFDHFFTNFNHPPKWSIVIIWSDLVFWTIWFKRIENRWRIEAVMRFWT